MDPDRIIGSAKEMAGGVEGTVGEMAGDAKTQASGRAREAAGTVQNLYGQAKDTAREAANTATSYAKMPMRRAATRSATARRPSPRGCRTIRSARS